MNPRRPLKPLAAVAVLGLYLVSLAVTGLLFLLANPLTDNRLPLRPFFEAWPFVMLVGLVALVWRHREPGVWWLAAAIGAAPLFGLALIMFRVVAWDGAGPLPTLPLSLRRGERRLPSVPSAFSAVPREARHPWKSVKSVVSRPPHLRRIFSIALPLASSSTSLSR